MKLVTLTFILFSFSFLSGCGYPMELLGVYKASDRLPGGFNAGAFAEKTVDFEVLKVTALDSCLHCHTSGGKSMDTPEKVIALKSEILDSIQKGSMPPRSSGYKQLGECEKQILETWLDDQTQSRGPSRKVGELSKCSDAAPAKPKAPTDFATLALSYENLSKEILAPKCLSCHTDETARKTVLDQYALLSAQMLLAETAEESMLYKVTVGTAKRFMPPKNKGIDPLTDAEKDYLKRWIEAGAPEKSEPVL
jgi:uncharacterized membrane protein